MFQKWEQPVHCDGFAAQLLTKRLTNNLAGGLLRALPTCHGPCKGVHLLWPFFLWYQVNGKHVMFWTIALYLHLPDLSLKIYSEILSISGLNSGIGFPTCSILLFNKGNLCKGRKSYPHKARYHVSKNDRKSRKNKLADFHVMILVQNVSDNDSYIVKKQRNPNWFFKLQWVKCRHIITKSSGLCENDTFNLSGMYNICTG